MTRLTKAQIDLIEQQLYTALSRKKEFLREQRRAEVKDLGEEPDAADALMAMSDAEIGAIWRKYKESNSRQTFERYVLAQLPEYIECTGRLADIERRYAEKCDAVQMLADDAYTEILLGGDALASLRAALEKINNAT